MKMKQITNRTFLLTAIIGSLLIIAMVTANSIHSSHNTILKTEEAIFTVSRFYLESIADRRSHTVANQIESEFIQMETALDYIQHEDIESQEELRQTLGKIKNLLSLNRFALVDQDNVVYTQYTTYTGKSRHEFLSEETMTDRTISTVSIYGSYKQLCLAIPTPDLTIMGKPFKACFIQIDIKDIIDLLSVDNKSSTYFALYSKNGSNLSGTELGPAISYHNIFDATKGLVSEDVWKENMDHFANDVGGSMTFIYGGVTETLCYVPLLNTGWEFTVLIHENVILDQIRDISENNLLANRKQITFTFFAELILAAILFLELRELSKEKLNAEKETRIAFQNMATKDSMTGVRNKHAYLEYENDLNRKIHNNELKHLAVVVCDINGLKHINDTLGHAAGDKLIKDACALICEIFIHGAVFRVGGDEFVVLLQDKGYDSMNETISTMNRKVEANIHENGVVVSIGYAVLEEGDHHVRDIFERADKMMYVRKQELKAMGAKTRDS